MSNEETAKEQRTITREEEELRIAIQFMANQRNAALDEIVTLNVRLNAALTKIKELEK